MITDHESAVMTVAEACRVLGICRNTVHRLIRRGVIPSLRLGRKRVIPRAAVQRMLDSAGAREETDPSTRGTPR